MIKIELMFFFLFYGNENIITLSRENVVPYHFNIEFTHLVATWHIKTPLDVSSSLKEFIAKVFLTLGTKCSEVAEGLKISYTRDKLVKWSRKN